MNNFEVLDGSLIKYTFPVSASDFESALDKAFTKVKPNIEIKGFRKGKVSREIFEKKKGVESLYEEALDTLLNEFYFKVLASKPEHLIRKLIDTNIDKKIKRGEDFVMSLTFDYIPDFKLPKYEGIEVKENKVEVTDELLKTYIRTNYPSLLTETKKKDGVIAKGNIALFDFKGFVGEEAFEGGEASNYRLEIGSGQFIPGFEDQMIGMKKGETKDLFVTFPEQYHAENLKGKDAKFVVTIKEVYEEKIDYSKAVSKDQEKVDPNAEAERIKKELEEHLFNNEKARQYEEALRSLVAATDLTLSKYMIDEKIEMIINQEKRKAEQYRIPFEFYLQYMGYGDEATFLEQSKEIGEQSAKLDLIIERIIMEKDIQVPKADVEAFIKDTPGVEFSQAEFFLKRSLAEKLILDNIKTI